MRALTIHEYGPPDVLKIEEIETPTPGNHQVLIEVKNSSINPVDWKVRSGQLSLILPRKWPRVVGIDCAGTITAVGSSVKNFAVGDEVFGMSNPLRTEYGGYAQFAICDTDSIAKKPQALSFSDAASIPVAALTAHKAFKHLMNLKPDQSVLINGASGGVGSFAVQLAKIIGAKVTATCGADNIDFVRSLGADEVVDYKTVDVTAFPAKFDGVFDASAKLNFRNACKILKSGGVYVTTVPDPYTVVGMLISFIRGKKAHIVNAGTGAFISRELSELADFVVVGQLKPIIASTVSLDQVAAAHAQSAQGHARGKVVVSI